MFLELAPVTASLPRFISMAEKRIHFSLQFHFLNPDYQPPFHDNVRPSETKLSLSRNKRSRRRKIAAMAKVKRSFLVLWPLKFKGSIATCQPSRFDAKPGNCTQDKSNFYNTRQRCRSKLFRQCLFELPRDFVSFS